MTASPASGRHIFLSTGEASGDRYAAALVAALREQAPDLRFSALGGTALAMAGVSVVQSSRDITVMGFGEVATHLPAILRARRRVFRHLASEHFDAVVPVDFPGFNTGLAGRAHRQGIPVFYVVAPQLWAWGAWRMAAFRRNVDRLATILPFEPEYFRARGLDVVPIGHPLMEDYASFPFDQRRAEREARRDDPGKPLTLGLLPGSRQQEVVRLLPRFKVAAGMIQSWLGQRRVRVLVSAAPGSDRAQLAAIVGEMGQITDEPLPLLLERLDLALVCSGTASLEASLAGVPHAVAYQTSGFNYAIGRALVRVPYIGLSNLILDKPAVPEMIQDQAAPTHLANALLAFLNQARRRDEFYADCHRLRLLCGGAGVWRRAATALLAFLDERAGA